MSCIRDKEKGKTNTLIWGFTFLFFQNFFQITFIRYALSQFCFSSFPEQVVDIILGDVDMGCSRHGRCRCKHCG